MSLCKTSGYPLRYHDVKDSRVPIFLQMLFLGGFPQTNLTGELTSLPVGQHSYRCVKLLVAATHYMQKSFMTKHILETKNQGEMPT